MSHTEANLVSELFVGTLRESGAGLQLSTERIKRSKTYPQSKPRKKNDRLVIISRGLISSELQILVSTIASLSQGERNTKRMKGKMQYLRASSICKMSVNKSNLKWSPVPLVSFFFFF